MQKLFISQPMKGKTDEEIKLERKRVIELAKRHFGDDLEVIDSFFEGQNDNPLVCLGESLKRMAEADIVWFAFGWEKTRGCMMEREAVEKYLTKTTIVEERQGGYAVIGPHLEWGE